MLQTKEMDGQDHGNEGTTGMSRRQFMTSTAIGLLAGMTVGVGGVLRFGNLSLGSVLTETPRKEPHHDTATPTHDR